MTAGAGWGPAPDDLEGLNRQVVDVAPGSTTSRCSILPKVIEPNVELLYKHDLGIVHTRTRNYEQARSLGVFPCHQGDSGSTVEFVKFSVSAQSYLPRQFSPPMQVCVSPATDVWRHSLSAHELDALQAYVC